MASSADPGSDHEERSLAHAPSVQTDAVDETEAPVEHAPHSTSLIRRVPSREEDEARLSGIHNSYTAASLRQAVGTRAAKKLHEPIEFSWKQFWTTLLYEMLPPVFFSPLAALLIEPSKEEAWHVVQHRALLATSSKYRPRSSVLGTLLIQYPMLYLLHIALVMAWMGTPETLPIVDPFQVTLAYGFFVVRNCIVAVKYGYLRPEDVAQLRREPPHWDEDRTNRRLIFFGWRSPAKFPGLIEDELTCAMDENDIALQGMSFRIGKKAAKVLRNHPTNELFTAATPSNESDEVSAGFIAHQLLLRSYSVPFPAAYTRLMVLLPIVMGAIPLVARWRLGLPILGQSTPEILISIAVFMGCFFGSMPVIAFGLISAHDFNRRANLIGALGKLIRFPGLDASTLLNTSTGQPSDTAAQTRKRVFIDLNHADNVFAWMNCRKALRSFGEGYYQRTQVYTSILLGYALTCIFVLNVLMWGQVPHHVGTIYLISAVVFFIASIALASIFKATRLQGLSREHRDLIKRQIFIQEKRMLELEPKSDEASVESLVHAQSLLQQVDEMIHFQEEIYKPTRVLGQAATNNVLSSTLGVLIAGVFFAVEGSGGVRNVYDALGWFLR